MLTLFAYKLYSNLENLSPFINEIPDIILMSRHDKLQI